MIVVDVFGVGDAAYHLTTTRIARVSAELGIAVHLASCTDCDEMLKRGVFAVPAVMLNGRLRSVGRVPAAAEIIDWLTVL